MRVEIRIYTDAGEELLVSRKQLLDPVRKKPQETPGDTLKAAYSDALAWLRRPTRPRT